MEKLEYCPICKSKDFSIYLKTKDYTLTNEEFILEKCNNCGFIFTNPRPEKNIIGSYYDSPDYISHTNSSHGFINGLYQLIKRYSLIKKYQLILNYKKSGKILDIGCGTGDFLNIFKKNKWDTAGIEPNDKARNYAKDNYNLNVFTEEQLKIFAEKSFDVITLWHVLEHLSDLNEKLDTINKLLKNDGILIVAVPNCIAKDAEIYKQFWAAYDVPRHLYHFSPNTIELLFKLYKMKIIKILPMIFDAFYVSMLSEKYKYGKINLLRAFRNGLKSNLYAIKSGNKYSSQIYIIKKEF